MSLSSCGMEQWERESKEMTSFTPEETSLEENEGEESEEGANDSDSSSNDGDSAADNDDTSQSESSASYPTATSSNDDQSESTATDTAAGVPNEFDWTQVLITEVVTDPQQDHGESTMENGIPFDPYPGTGTVGSSDEYVEIYNGTTESIDVSLWSINMLDGTDELQELKDDDWEVYFSNDGSLESFGPGEFLVLGNPTGAMNNTITLELLSDTGETVDSVDVENANASDLNDEAYYRSPEGDWVQGWASPGFFLE